MVRLLLDECVDVDVASGLSARGHDVTTARDLGLLHTDDRIVFERAVALGRVVFTHNYAEFAAFAGECSDADRPYPGILVARMLSVGELVRRLDTWLNEPLVERRIGSAYTWLPRTEAR